MFCGIRKHLDILWSQERLGNWHILQKKEQENKTDGPKRYSYHTKITDAHFTVHCINVESRHILKLWLAPETNKCLFYAFINLFSITNSGLSFIGKFAVDK